MSSRFHWTTFDLNGYLPAGWQKDIRAAAVHAEFRDFPRTPVLSREAVDVQRIPRGRVHADHVRYRLPWLYGSYHRYFLDLAGEACAGTLGIRLPRPPCRRPVASQAEAGCSDRTWSSGIVTTCTPLARR